MDHPKISLAVGPQEIERTHPVMRELRPHLSLEQFCAQVARQQSAGFQLVYLEQAGQIQAVAGFRVIENLAWGKILFVDDLVTRAEEHGRGFGSQLFDWLLEHARANGCVQFHLDSGVHRFGAHRFYLHKGMDITCHHFGLKL